MYEVQRKSEVDTLFRPFYYRYQQVRPAEKIAAILKTNENQKEIKQIRILGSPCD
jgi:hypothetical protein